MRHVKRTAKLGRKGDHRNAMLANLVCSLIQNKRITTTLAKARAARPVAEKIVTLGKRGTIHAKRLVASKLRYHSLRMLPTKEEGAKARQNDVVRILFDEIAPTFKERNGGYTRIVKLHQRQGDAAQLAILEWVDFTGAPAAAASAPATESKPAEQSAPSGEQK